MIRRFVILWIAFLTLVSESGANATSPFEPPLDALAAAFGRARSLPPGTNPPPPLVINISTLVGSDAARVVSALGEPTVCTHDTIRLRPDSTCWLYTYGRAAAPRVSDDGTEIVVMNGGPWLLVFAVSDGRVIAVDWRGQT